MRHASSVMPAGRWNAFFVNCCSMYQEAGLVCAAALPCAPCWPPASCLSLPPPSPCAAAPYARQLLLEGSSLQDAQMAKVKRDLQKGFANQVGH